MVGPRPEAAVPPTDTGVSASPRGLHVPGSPRENPPSQRVPHNPTADVTAEMPVVAPPRRRAAPRPERGSAEWYATRRQPAPYSVRLVVWLLSLVLVLVLAGSAVARYHPSWLNFLRSSTALAIGTNGAPAAASSSTTTPSSRPVSRGGFHLISQSATSSTYSVPSGTYSLVVTTAAPCWTAVSEPAGSRPPKYAEDVLASVSPKAFPVSGSSSIEISAAATSIAVESGGTTVGTITSPKLGPPYSYSFIPNGG